MSDRPKRPTKKAATSVGRELLALTYDGVEYTLPLSPRDVPLFINRELDLQSRVGGEGLSIEDIVMALGSGRARGHHVAAFIFAAKRYQGEPASYLAIEAKFNPDKVDVGFSTRVEGDSPEAPGAD